jgi:hypothetical protein
MNEFVTPKLDIFIRTNNNTVTKLTRSHGSTFTNVDFEIKMRGSRISNINSWLRRTRTITKLVKGITNAFGESGQVFDLKSFALKTIITINSLDATTAIDEFIIKHNKVTYLPLNISCLKPSLEAVYGGKFTATFESLEVFGKLMQMLLVCRGACIVESILIIPSHLT